MDLKIITISAISYCVIFIFNDFILDKFYVDQYLSLVFLPSGLRVLISMVFESSGAIGLALGSLLLSIFYIHEPSTAVIIGNAVASGVGAFVARELCVRILDLDVYLHQINLKQIMWVSITFSVINSLLHQSIFIFSKEVITFF